VALTPAVVAAADCVVVITDHTAIDWAMVRRHARGVVDTRHVLPRDA
jgi:UDP-N-acetyl-D-glucosamine dehydrogenase